MYTYAQLEDNVVTGISQLSGEVTNENMVVITDLTEQPELGSVYNPESSAFTPSRIEPLEPQPSLQEIQTQTLLNTEYLVIMSELTNI